MLGTSDSWSMIHLYHRPSNQAYHIVDWGIFRERISPHGVQPLRLRIQHNGLKSSHISIFYKSCLCIQYFLSFITICWIWIVFHKFLVKMHVYETEILLQKEFRPWFWLAIIAWPGPEVPSVKETFMLFQD